MAKNRKKTQKGNHQIPVKEALRVLIDKKAYAALLAHASGTVDAEVGGILLGKTGQNWQGTFVHVNQIISSKFALEQATSFTFTHESWNFIHNEKEANYPDLDIIGWYHTHPGYGVELSDQDRFIHSSFFSAPYHVAYVYDPLSGAEAFYIHPDGNLTQAEHYWLGDRIRRPLNRPLMIEVQQSPSSLPKIQVMMPRWGWGVIGVLAMVVFLLGAWILSSMPNRSLFVLAAASSPTVAQIFISVKATPSFTYAPEPILSSPTPTVSPIPTFTPIPPLPTLPSATPIPSSTSTNTSTPSPSPTARVVWKVRAGETLAWLAWHFCVSRSALEQANGLAPGSQVRVGDLITIPEPQREPIVYIIQPGDTLSELAIRFCVSIEEIMDANGITNPRRLRIDQEVTIPNAVVR